jgi:hypothetical protein
LIFAAGIALVALTLNDIFQSVIVPRAAVVGRYFRPSHYLWRLLWRAWPVLAMRLHPTNSQRREDVIATFAPFNLVLMLASWAVLLTLGFGGMLWQFRDAIHPVPSSLAQAVYFAGTSFFTIGFGDFVGGNGFTRLISLAAGGSGVLTVAITTAFLFALFGAFQAREQFVVTTGARAGSPPSGVGLLAIAARKGVAGDLPSLMRDAQNWAASVMETHLAYPPLAYFRSSHDFESWVGTLGTLLDAATLMATTVQCNAGEARIFFDIGRHAVRDLAAYFLVDGVESNPGVTQQEFDLAYDRLAAAGLALHDRASAWEQFASMRAAYAGALTALARHFAIPPLEWVGDRSLITAHHMLGE